MNLHKEVENLCDVLRKFEEHLAAKHNRPPKFSWYDPHIWNWKEKLLLKKHAQYSCPLRLAIIFEKGELVKRIVEEEGNIEEAMEIAQESGKQSIIQILKKIGKTSGNRIAPVPTTVSQLLQEGNLPDDELLKEIKKIIS